MRIFRLIVLIYLPNLAFAANIDEKLWTQMHINGSLFDSKKIHYNLRGEMRFIDQEHGFDTGIAGYALGYQYLSNLSFWIGYQWDSQNQITGALQQNRIWQQIDWDMFKILKLNFSQRLRLEERFREGDSQTAYRLRERMVLKTNELNAKSVNFLTWNEIFFNLNRPPWVNDHTINQNRYFIGIEVIPKTNLSFEAGYLNRYSLSNVQNTVSHILFFNLNIKAS